MFAVRAITLLCFISVSHSAPLACKDLLQPLDQVDPNNFQGTWTMVADSLKIEPGRRLSLPDSTVLYFYNSTFTKVNHYDEMCDYFSHNVSIEGPHYNFQVGQSFNFSGTLYRTSCADCVVLSFMVDTPGYKSEELCLFSKRREVDEKELREFIAQVECLKMPEPVVMDPNQPLCPILKAK